MHLNSNWREGLSAERELILCCTRTHLDEVTSGRIREILRGPLDWPVVTDTAFNHHVETSLYENLSRITDSLVPDARLNIIRESMRKSGGMSVLLSSELLRICGIFDAEGISVIPFKGPVLGWLAYGNLTRRRFLDLDFFVPQKDMAKAATLLKTAGFQTESDRPEELEGRTDYIPGQYAFYREATRAQVELHTERTMRYFPTPLDFEKMSRRLITVELCGRELRTFSVEDTLVMLSVHGAKHFWDRLSWILDIAALIKTQSVDWPLTLRIAAKLKSTRLLLLGVYLAHELMAAPVPQVVLDQARQDRNVQWLAAKVLNELAGGVSSHTGVLPRAIFRFRSRDGVADGIRHMARLATTPTENHGENGRLPKAFAPLYKFTRPWKLIQQYGIGLRSGAPAGGSTQKINGHCKKSKTKK